MEGSPWALARRVSLLAMLVLVACGNSQPARLANANATASSSTAVGLPTWSALPSPWVPSLSPTIAPTSTPAPTHAPPTNRPTARATPGPTSSGGGGGGGTNVVFADNFSGSGVDTSKWLVQNGGRTSNGEMQCYSAANTTEGGGALTETVRVDPACNNTSGGGGGGGYSSGAIQSHFTFTYGTLSVRAKMAGGAGPWPAIWLLGHNCQPWELSPNGCQPKWPQPGSDEIDIAEILNSNHSSVNQQVHMSAGAPGCMPSTSDTAQNWHTYTLVWAPGRLTWKIDGSTTCTDTSAVPSQAMFLIINTAIGGSGGGGINQGTLPQSTMISSVTITR